MLKRFVLKWDSHSNNRLRGREMKTLRTNTVVLVSIMLLAAALSGCAQKKDAAPAAGLGPATLRYCLWDQLQLPAYKAIADNFMRENPGVTVTIEITPIADYWTKLTTQAAGGNCPDLMTMMMNQFIAHTSNDNLQAIDDYVKADNVDLTKYNKDYLDAISYQGKLYGLPKDFDAYGIFYNKDLLAKAGYSSYPKDLYWDYETGGTWVEFLQKVTVDRSGRNALDPAFNPRAIAQYGINLMSRTWYNPDQILAILVNANDGRVFDEQGFLALDEPKALEALKFLGRMVHDWHVVPGLNIITASGSESLFYSQGVACWINGPWTTGDMTRSASFKWGIADLPKGPTGKSYSRANSLYDSIYARSPSKDAAWKFALYIATAPGQDLLGNTGTVIPAYGPSSTKYVEYYRDKGVPDVRVFIDGYNGLTVTPPKINNWARVDDMTRAMFGGSLTEGKTVADVEAAVIQLVREVNAFQTPIQR